MIIYSTRASRYSSNAANRGLWYPSQVAISDRMSSSDTRLHALSGQTLIGLVESGDYPAAAEIKYRFLSEPERITGKLIEMLSNPWLKENAGNILKDLSALKKDYIVKCLAGSLREKLYGNEAGDVLYRIALDDPLAVIRPIAASLITPSYRIESSKLLLAVSNFEPDFVARKMITCLSDPRRKSVASGLLKQMSELSPYHRTVIGSKMTEFIVEDDLFSHIRSLLVDIWKWSAEFDPHARSIGEYMFPMIEPFGKALCSDRKRFAAARMLSELGAHFPLSVTRYVQHLKAINSDNPDVLQVADKIIGNIANRAPLS